MSAGATDGRQLRRAWTVADGAGYRHVQQFDACRRGAQHESAPAHVTPADEVGREQQSVAEHANWAGIPTEGYGFSKRRKGVLGAPSFSAASFPYDGQNLDLTMSLHY